MSTVSVAIMRFYHVPFYSFVGSFITFSLVHLLIYIIIHLLIYIIIHISLQSSCSPVPASIILLLGYLLRVRQHPLPWGETPDRHPQLTGGEVL